MDLNTIQEKLNLCYGKDIHNIFIEDNKDDRRYKQNDQLSIFHKDCNKVSRRTLHQLFYLLYPCKFCKCKYHRKVETKDEEEELKKGIEQMRKKLKYMVVYENKNNTRLQNLLEIKRIKEKELLDIIHDIEEEQKCSNQHINNVSSSNQVMIKS